MIAKGTPHKNGATLARYLITGKEHERAELWELRGFASAGIVDAFRSVHVMAAGTRCRAPFFHVYVRNPEGEALEPGQWEHTANCIERMLGLTNQPRAIAFHTAHDTGHSHMHVAWSRIDEETLTARPLPFFKQRLKTVSRELEALFGLMPVPNQRERSIRFAPTRAEEQQGRRLGLDVHITRETIRSCFDRSDSGRSFQSALAARNLILARGDRRDFLVMDWEGGMHALGKRILGVSAAAIRERLADLQRHPLPSVEEARRSVLGQQEKNYRSTHRRRLPVNEPVQPKPRNRAKNLEDASSDSQQRSLSPPPDNRLADESEPAPPAIAGRLLPASAPAATVGAVPERTNGPNTEAGSRRFSTFLKSQFRALVKALTKRPESPQPHARRRRSGETAGAFRLAARAILHPISHLPFVAPAAAFLYDVLTWLHLWEWNESTDDHDVSCGPGRSENNHLSPRP
jgi:hypothetical protein